MHLFAFDWCPCPSALQGPVCEQADEQDSDRTEDTEHQDNTRVLRSEVTASGDKDTLWDEDGRHCVDLWFYGFIELEVFLSLSNGQPDD